MTQTISLGRERTVLEKIRQMSGQNLYACYQCGKCTAGCPFSFSPQRVVRSLQLGMVENALAEHTTWECAGCETCTAACPKGVDPVRIMRALRTLDVDELEPPPGSLNGSKPYEALKPYYKAHKKPIRSHLFAKVDWLSHLGSRFAPFSNWLLSAPGGNLVAHYFLGIHKDRSLPKYVKTSETFPAWFSNHTPAGDGHRGTVLLFHDTFMDHNVPDVGIAATELLEKAGFKVELTDTECCGRAMISKNFLDRATEQACINVPRLYEHVREGVYIVGCEPSCLLTLRDEYLYLVDDPELKRQAEVVAKQTMLIDEFLVMLAEQDELELEFNGASQGKSVVFHGHCQQKALADPAKSVSLLNMAGYEAEMVNAVCCGMAGTFGYEKEHYELSKIAGERDLFPAVRANPDADIVVMGISCRHQLDHFTDRESRHLTQALRDATV